MNKNPLTTTIIAFAIGDAYYLTKSRFSGSYLFYSIIPIFPIYFGLKLIGLNPPPATSTIFIIGFLLYVVAIGLLWKQKRDYDRYMAAERVSDSAVS